jgi:4-hydroxyphenylacetate 3-monooxygenase
VSKQEPLRVTGRRPGGVVVRGAKGVGTQAPYANEIVCMTAPRPDLTPEQGVYFATPVNADGIHVVCREPLASANAADHPVSPSWDEMDAIVVFDDVFVPWERVFYLRRSPAPDLDAETQLFQGAVGLGPWYVLVRMAVKAEVLLGLCAALAESLGSAAQPLVQNALADAMVYLETLRAFVQAAEANPVRSVSGLAMPNPTTALAGRTFAIERYPALLQHIREISGPGILMAPGQADLDSAEVGPYLHRYFLARDEGAMDRVRLFKLAWEYACDSFGSRQLLFEMQNAGSLATNRQRLATTYDTRACVALARRLAGLAEAGSVDAAPA